MESVYLQKLIRRNFAAVRRENGLTQEQISDLSRISQQYLSELEGGKCNPTVITLNKIAIALGVTINDLVKLR